MENKNPRIKIQPIEPPSAWDRRVLFFSNIHSIHYGNVEETRQLLGEISALASRWEESISSP
jgi:hypothetical protein